MKRTLKTEINCGDITCAKELGRSCDFVDTIIQLVKWPKIQVGVKCVIFDTPLEDKDGWIQRCQACLDAEAK